MSCVRFDEPELLKLAGLAAEDVIFTRPFYDLQAGAPTVKRFASAYEMAYGAAPTVFAAHAYDALGIIATAIGATKPPYSPDRIADRIRQISDYDGVAGKTSFAANNEVVKQPQFMQVSEGRFVPYEK